MKYYYTIHCSVADVSTMHTCTPYGMFGETDFLIGHWGIVCNKNKYLSKWNKNKIQFKATHQLWYMNSLINVIMFLFNVHRFTQKSLLCAWEKDIYLKNVPSLNKKKTVYHINMQYQSASSYIMRARMKKQTSLKQ